MTNKMLKNGEPPVQGMFTTDRRGMEFCGMQEMSLPVQGRGLFQAEGIGNVSTEQERAWVRAARAENGKDQRQGHSQMMSGRPSEPWRGLSVFF